MSWFGMGGGSDKEKAPERSMKIDDFDHSSASKFDNSDQFRQPSAPSGGAGGSFEQEVMMEQQRAVLQAVMMKLTESAFDNCVTKPSSSLSGGEKSCISASVGKYLDTSELIAAKMGGGQ